MYSKTIVPTFEENTTNSMYRTAFDREKLNARIHQRRNAKALSGSFDSPAAFAFNHNRGSQTAKNLNTSKGQQSSANEPSGYLTKKRDSIGSRNLSSRAIEERNKFVRKQIINDR